MVKDLKIMIYMGKDVNFSITRKFVVDFYMIDLADYILYSAFIAPKDEIFYQSR